MFSFKTYSQHELGHYRGEIKLSQEFDMETDRQLLKMHSKNSGKMLHFNELDKCYKVVYLAGTLKDKERILNNMKTDFDTIQNNKLYYSKDKRLRCVVYEDVYGNYLFEFTLI